MTNKGEKIAFIKWQLNSTLTPTSTMFRMHGYRQNTKIALSTFQISGFKTMIEIKKYFSSLKEWIYLKVWSWKCLFKLNGFFFEKSSLYDLSFYDIKKFICKICRFLPFVRKKCEVEEVEPLTIRQYILCNTGKTFWFALYLVYLSILFIIC